jgi:hypothetical protein
VKHKTRVADKTGDETVLLQGIDCTGLSADEHTKTITGIDVKFRFTTSEGSFSTSYLSRITLPKRNLWLTSSLAAEHFQEKIEEMRVELSIISLQFPQADERTILKL